jgi:O-antigen ligase
MQAATTPLAPRHSWAPLPVYLVLFAGLVALTAWLGLRIHHQSDAYPAPVALAPLAADKSYGVTTDLSALSEAERQAALRRMGELNLRWVRQPFRWHEIESERGRYEWSRWDDAVAAADQHGMRIIALLDTTPEWARPAGTSPHTPPTEMSDFGAFAHALAERYGDRLDAYQVWDEPNLSAHWGNRYVEPRSYARMLREAAINIRQVAPGAVILTAALAPTIESGPLNLNEMDFLDQLYQAQAAEWFDVVAAQPYGFTTPPDASPAAGSLNFARAALLRRVMLAHADADKPVWITGFGWRAERLARGGGTSSWPTVGSVEQQRYTAQAIALLRSEWPWLGPALFTTWDAVHCEPDDPRRELALVDGEILLPPAAGLRAADTGDRIATVGTYPAAHLSGRYTGDWRVSAFGADVPRRPPAVLTIEFEGTRLDLLVRRGDYKGFLYVTVDGQPANDLPQQDGRAYLLLFDPLELPDEVTVARYLPDGRHTATIEAEGGWHQWPIVGWRVQREADVRTEVAGAMLAGLFALAALVGAFRQMRRLPWRAWPSRLLAGYESFGTAPQLVLLALAALAFYLAPGTALSLVGLALLFVAILPRPDLGLALVAFSLPFFLLPKSLVGRTISMTEVALIVVALVLVTRRAVHLVSVDDAASPATTAIRPRAPTNLDWAAWLLTAAAVFGALMTVLPLPGSDWVRGAGANAALMLLPLAGVLAALAGVAADKQAAAQAWQHGSVVWQLDMAVAGLAGLALVASLAADNVAVAFQEFHVVVWDAAVFYAFARLVGRRPGLAIVSSTGATVVVGFLLGATVMAAYATHQFFGTEQVITAEGVRRALGVYGSPNNLALLLDRAAPVLIAWLAFGTHGNSTADDSRSSQVRMRLRRIVLALALTVVLTALILTFSRGALLLGMPAALVFIGIMRGRRALGVALALLAAGVGGIAPVLGTDRLRSLVAADSGTAFFRLRLWESAWAMLREHPWLGVGPDNFLYQYRTRYLLPDAWQEPNLSHPHNLLLDFGTRLGIGGVAILIWLQVVFWRLALSLYRRLPEGESRGLLLGLMASMVATLAHGLVDQSFFLVDLGFVYCLTLAFVANAARDASGTT